MCTASTVLPWMVLHVPKLCHPGTVLRTRQSSETCVHSRSYHPMRNDRHFNFAPISRQHCFALLQLEVQLDDLLERLKTPAGKYMYQRPGSLQLIKMAGATTFAGMPNEHQHSGDEAMLRLTILPALLPC